MRNILAVVIFASLLAGCTSSMTVEKSHVSRLQNEHAAVSATRTLMRSLFAEDKASFSRMVSQSVLRQVNDMDVADFMLGWKREFIRLGIWDGETPLADVQIEFETGETPKNGYVRFRGQEGKLNVLYEDGIWKLNES